jgi:hypothetical protein
VSIYEIYCEKIKDLLNPNSILPLKIRLDKEKNTYIENLTEEVVHE